MNGELARACAFVADMLVGGPRNAAAILASSEGAKLSRRTVQLASQRLGVIKTRPAFRGPWIWRLPAASPDAAPAALSAIDQGRADIIATRLRKREAQRGKAAPIHATDPRVLRWVASGLSDPDLREAYELAVFALERVDSQAPLTAGFLDGYVEKVRGEAA